MSTASVVTNPTNLLQFPQKPRIRNWQERETELSQLYSLYYQVRPFTGFGEDNRAAIAAQIAVIEGRMTLDEVEYEYEDGPNYTMSAALDALEWLRDGAEAPSEDWMRIVEAAEELMAEELVGITLD